jgi:hypothetical protein
VAQMDQLGSVAQMDQPRLRRWGGAIAVSHPGEVGEAMRTCHAPLRLNAKGPDCFVIRPDCLRRVED